MIHRDHIFQYTPCSQGNVFGNIAQGTVFLDTLPRVNIRRLCIRASPKRGRYWEILRVQGNLEGGGEIILNTSRVFVECGHSLIINLCSAIDLSQGPMAPQVKVPCAVRRGPLRRESRSHVVLRVEVPRDKIDTQKCSVSGVYRPLRPKSAIPHPITIQNMRFDQK